MIHEWEIRAAIGAEFGDGIRYERPSWDRGIHGRLAALSDVAEHGASLAVLAPARTETNWFQDLCAPWEVRFIFGRVVMDGYHSGAPFPSALVVMGPLARRGCLDGWKVPSAQLALLRDETPSTWRMGAA